MVVELLANSFGSSQYRNTSQNNLTAIQIEYRKLTDFYDQFFTIFYWIAGTIAIPMNVLLLYLIIKKSPPSLKVYKVLLLNQCITDLFYALSITFLQPRIIPNKWAFAYVALGPVKYLGSEFAYETYCVQLHSIFYTFLSFPLSFGFRYYVLVRPVPQIKSLIMLLLSLWSIAIFQHVSFIFSEWDSKKVLAYLAINKPHYNMSGLIVSGNHMLEKPMTSFVLATIVLPMFPIYVLVVYFYYKVEGFLTANADKLRAQTVKGHRRLLMALTIQAALPVFTIFPPIGIYGLYHLELINVTVIEYLVYVLFAFYPAFSPMITIYFVKPYNMAIQRATGLYVRSLTQTTTGFISETIGGEKQLEMRRPIMEKLGSSKRRSQKLHRETKESRPLQTHFPDRHST
ncbi:unnamed protein product, partial [Mesorhabditis belari]|uniref:G-protein coupled receptors family 1 profile domain-containing protein n=1 Tax=Mesorhabditis belari TaxID=2138241 RepID=A0AAF3JAY6_9BILA